jgi:hypothetical protein
VGTVYEENPTISYTPVVGAEYARQIFSPVPISLLTLMTEALADPDYVYHAVVSSINGIANPEFQLQQTDADPAFSRVVGILTRLSQMHHLQWVVTPGQPDRSSLVIDQYAPTYTAEVLELLELPAPTDDSTRIILPVFLALDGRDFGGLGITTRSVGDLVHILSAAIEVPVQDLQQGVATTYSPLGQTGNGLRIRYSETRPERAAVVVQYRSGWFYIDETDLVTKRFFRLMVALWSVTIAESIPQGSIAPVLTVPVSR